MENTLKGTQNVLNDKTKERIKKLKEAGYSRREIAILLGIEESECRGIKRG